MAKLSGVNYSSMNNWEPSRTVDARSSRDARKTAVFPRFLRSCLDKNKEEQWAQGLAAKDAQLALFTQKAHIAHRKRGL